MHMESSALPSRGSETVFVYFTTLDVTTEEQRPLLDLPTLVATVGGTIGMFLGWSILDATRAVSTWLHQLL